MSKMMIEKAIAAVESMLLDQWKKRPEHGSVRIYTWGGGIKIKGKEYRGDKPISKLKRHPCVGFRVAEVAFCDVDPETGLGGGSSFMQSDVGGSTACFFAERAVIARVENWENEEIIRCDYDLLYVIHGEKVAHVYGERKVPQ